MKTLRHLFILAALSLIATAGRAQVTYTNSVTGNPVFLGYNPNPNTALQTFTGFTSLSSVSWTLTNQLGSATTSTFNTYIAQWDATNNAVIGALTQFGTTGSLSLTGTNDVTFTGGWTAPDSENTYVLILSNVGGTSSAYTASTSTNPDGDFFAGGGVGSIATSGVSGSFLADLQGGVPLNPGGIDTSLSYTMSVTGIAATPVPEPKTAAAEIALLFVAVLVGRQLWLRRKAAPALQAV